MKNMLFLMLTLFANHSYAAGCPNNICSSPLKHFVLAVPQAVSQKDLAAEFKALQSKMPDCKFALQSSHMRAVAVQDSSIIRGHWSLITPDARACDRELQEFVNRSGLGLGITREYTPYFTPGISYTPGSSS